MTSRDEMIEHLESGEWPRIGMVIAALRDRPAPPDALVAKLNVRHDEALHTAIGWMSQEENLVTTREALIELLMMLKPVIFAAPAPVAAPAPETVTLPPHVPAIVLRRALNAPRRFEVGDVVTGVSTGMTDDGRWEQSITKVARNGQPLDVYGLSAAPAPETPAPDAMPEIQVGDTVSFDTGVVRTCETAIWGCTWNEPYVTRHIIRVERGGIVIWRRQEAQP